MQHMPDSTERVRERFWLWGHDAGAHNPGTGPIEWNLPGPSRITPLEAAVYLGISNLLLVRYNGTPTLPFDQLALSLRPLAKVLWSVTGAMGEKSASEREHVFALGGPRAECQRLRHGRFSELGHGRTRIECQ